MSSQPESEAQMRRGQLITRGASSLMGRCEAAETRGQPLKKEIARTLFPDVSKSMRCKSLPPAHRQFRRPEETLARCEDATASFPQRPPTRCAGRAESGNRTPPPRANRANFQPET